METSSNQSSIPLTVLAVGDIGPDREDAAELFALNSSLLQSGDVTFGQLEFVLSDQGSRLPQVRHTVRAKPKDAKALVDAGLDVVSFAGNHCLDFGAEAMLDTAENLTAAGAVVVGVGADIHRARKPAVVQRGQTEISFLSYSSVLPHSFWATENRPGCAPMRAFTVYEQVEHDQPGTPARVHTFPHRQDLAALVEDVRREKEQGRFVVVSVHWGIHFIPAVIADYQRDVAYAAIDAGADAIVGHHAHILKGIEIYRGAPIFYSLANFAMDTRVTPEQVATVAFQEILDLNPGWIPNFKSTYNFPPDSRKTIVAKLTIEDGKMADFGFFPGWINDNSQTEILTGDDERFDQVVEYMRLITKEAGIDTDYRREGDEVRPVALARDGR
ncbi:poly-gamma-glutamate capsule biosynthesis protein CapA/YwtB (metallophosphatase superfamily) [Arthrobacter bambusae]|uniref:Poly-gamma-glutamate capsule biosynthesis protein CapA/YwtB (Metallophosphatase superfamily) n=1 Tax=Arthrobacter bambusae TaxID=1338426 RepID=A0ABV2P114_9MICC